MNKSNKVLLGVLAFVVVCVIGYALFSETITVTGTATAEGNWLIDMSCMTGLSDEVIFPEDKPRYVDAGYANDSCAVNKNQVSFKTDLLYPSANRSITIKVENKGDIDAVFDLTDNDQEGGFSNTTINVCEINQNDEKVNCSSTFNYIDENGTENNDIPVAFVYLGALAKNGKFYDAWDIEGSNENFMNDAGEFTLEPGEIAYYLLEIEWPMGYTNENNKAHYSVDVTTHLNFVQIH